MSAECICRLPDNFSRKKKINDKVGALNFPLAQVYMLNVDVGFCFRVSTVDSLAAFIFGAPVKYTVYNSTQVKYESIIAAHI